MFGDDFVRDKKIHCVHALISLKPQSTDAYDIAITSKLLNTKRIKDPLPCVHVNRQLPFSCDEPFDLGRVSVLSLE